MPIYNSRVLTHHALFQGENIRSLSEKFPKTTINCQSEKDVITLDSPHEEFEAAHAEISTLVKELINTRTR